MLHLTLAGLSEDNQRLLLVSDSGEQFTLAVDARLRAALRGEYARLGQLEIQMESTLRPRDIQARIRAGESAEAVAAAAQTSVERILPFVNPVLAERAHMADRAQRSSVRRKTGDAGARTLGDAVQAQLRALNTHTDAVEWDAWRREDGRWTLVASYTSAKRSGTGHFCFDVPGNYVTAEDDDARWLVGDQVAKPAPAARDDLEAARRRRTAADDQLPLGDEPLENQTFGDDALALVQPAAEPAEPEAGAPEADEPGATTPAPPEPAATDETPTVDLSETAAAVAAARTPAEPPQEPTEQATADQSSGETEPVAPKKPARRKGRASVPSWDEIMFGGKSE